ncbi:DUF2098 domain-containing protein [uncultured Methanobrevibacter sp.]|uniref:DUF2098 domain-containing protein n=1 Tax=uncultured Methanobrevibacter sp. TaxID=253161 RepID=UPI0025DDF0AE|nr:DUF2098 domain-containing protein [uncultured Methanobrevibacter sp.]
MAFDARDKEISVDDFVRYVDTGTMGKVLEIKTEDEVDWVLIDKTNLWYKAKLVEILDEKDIKIKFTPSGREVDIEELKEKADKLENMQMDSSVAEGGG